MSIDSLNGLTNSAMVQQSMEMQIAESKTESFQDTFDRALASKDDEELMAAAKEFETYFINMLFKQMRATINYAGGMFERSTAEKLYQEMLDEEYAKISAESGTFGLAKSIYGQMKHTI